MHGISLQEILVSHARRVLVPFHQSNSTFPILKAHHLPSCGHQGRQEDLKEVDHWISIGLIILTQSSLWGSDSPLWQLVLHSAFISTYALMVVMATMAGEKAPGTSVPAIK